MGADTKIEWADHTFNPWVGCKKVSQACTNCYAEGWAKRTGQAGLWRGERRRTSPANWRQPLKWNRETPGARVFCASLADVFEDNPAVQEWRVDLFELIIATPNLTWLLLTKRPAFAADWFRHCPPPRNVWVGTTVEDQAAADERIPHLLRVPASVRFLSAEPLLGPIDLTRVRNWFDPAATVDVLRFGTWWTPAGFVNHSDMYSHYPPGPIGWVIAGGESGPKARPSHQNWFRSLRNQCVAVGVPFLFKQWGEWAPGSWTAPARSQGSQLMAADGRIKSITEAFDPVAGDALLLRVGKARAGRELDGRTWDQFPAVSL